MKTMNEEIEGIEISELALKTGNLCAVGLLPSLSMSKYQRDENGKWVARYIQMVLDIVAKNNKKIKKDQDLLNLAMNQLFRAARTLELTTVGARIKKDDLIILGCDLTANVILERLKKSKNGLELIKQTNPQLLSDEND